MLTIIADNHKPTLSSETAPNHARLKPSIPGKTSSYDLSFDDDGSKYSFAGARKTDDDQYVMYFNAERKAFVLDKVDSTFDMNVTRVPGNSDPDDLRKQYPHLKSKAKTAGRQEASSKPAADSSKSKSSAAAQKKSDKKQETKRESLAMPAAKSETKPKKKSQFEEDDEEEDDDDGGLLIEYPGGNNAPPKQTDFSPAFPTQRRFDEYMDRQESGADDADAESDEDPDLFKLPSPVKKPAEPQPQPQAQDQPMPDAQDDGSADLEAALEAEMEIAFEDLANSQEEGKGGDESEISEED